MSILPELTILIPVFNESKYIIPLLDSITQLPEFKTYELIIINDGSTDDSHNLISSWILKSGHLNVRYIDYEKNQGKTNAIKTGIEKTTGNYTIIQDGDLEYDILDIKRLLDYIKKNQLDSVIGHRTSKFQRLSPYDITLKSGVVILTILFNILYRSKFKDLSGGYKIFNTNSLKTIELEGKGFTFCYEVVIKFLKKKYTVGQLNINYHARDRKTGKKISLIDGAYCFLTIIKYLK